MISVTKHQSLVCDFKIKVKDIRRKFSFRRKIQKLHEDSAKSDFRSYISKYRASSQKDASVEGYWNALKGDLSKATHRCCGWKKGPVRHKKVQWWNDDDFSYSVSEKQRLLKEWKQGTTNKEKYLETKKEAQRNV